MTVPTEQVPQIRLDEGRVAAAVAAGPDYAPGSLTVDVAPDGTGVVTWRCVRDLSRDDVATVLEAGLGGPAVVPR